jgi:hypothetical protein
MLTKGGEATDGAALLAGEMEEAAVERVERLLLRPPVTGKDDRATSAPIMYNIYMLYIYTYNYIYIYIICIFMICIYII